MKVEVTKKARKRIDIVDRFWRQHRPAAPDRFVDELDEAFRKLADGTAIGVLYRRRQRSEIHRLLLPDTQQWVYYTVLKARQTIRILSVWGARRRPKPNV